MAQAEGQDMRNKVPEWSGRRGLRQRLFAWMYSHSTVASEVKVIDQHKRALLSGLQGDVLEIGPGVGDNLPYFPPAIHWIGVEPNLYMHEPLREAMRRAGFQGELRTGTAERLPVADDSVDVVVSTFVQCSISNLDAALQEIIRVLRPGGRFVFLEHVAAPAGTSLRRTQRVVAPLWQFFGDGCNPARDIEPIIRRAGFASVSIQTFRAPVPIVSPNIAGRAIKAGDQAAPIGGHPDR